MDMVKILPHELEVTHKAIPPPSMSYQNTRNDLNVHYWIKKMNKCRYIHIMEYYTEVEVNALEIHVSTWKNLENFVQSI